MKAAPYFATEGAMVEAARAWLAKHHGPGARNGHWVCYPESAGFDLLLVNAETGEQIGVEAKLRLNPKVIAQALPSLSLWAADSEGPDFRAVMVPADNVNEGCRAIAEALGLAVMAVRRDGDCGLMPGRFAFEGGGNWAPWLPAQRCQVPDYVPDVAAGVPCPLKLTPWKVKAIKLLQLLDLRGVVTRRDMKALGISPTMWCAHPYGYLAPSPERGGYVRCGRTPDLQAQHPVNWAEIEADQPKWLATLPPPPVKAQPAPMPALL